MKLNPARILVAALALLASSSQAKATFLAPGATVVPDSNGLATSDVLLATTGPQAFSFLSGTGTDSGTFTASVYRTAAGTIDITYRVTNNANSISSLELVSPADFAAGGPSGSVTTDVSATGAGVSPLSASRGALDGGHVISFNFTTGHEIAPGQSSQLLIVRTNGIAFTAGTSGVSDGGATTVSGYTPLLSVPEPNSVALLCLGVAGFVGISLRRQLSRKLLA